MRPGDLAGNERKPMTNFEENDTIPVPDTIRRIASSADRKLAWHFFVFFSRMEYALKRSGRYLKAGTTDAQPNWDKFGSDYSSDFHPETSRELKRAVDYFLRYPPRKQLVAADGSLIWSEPQSRNPTEPLLKWLFLMIRCVRNNLFHGGKFPSIPISDPSRDRDLLLSSMVILNAALDLDSTVRKAFEQGIHE
jgi:hypothetical protein